MLKLCKPQKVYANGRGNAVLIVPRVWSVYMAAKGLTTFVRRLQGLADTQTGQLPDEQLLQLFVCQRSEEAFGAIMRRHGPLVLRICRQILTHAEDADDAFQATFLVLARRADSISR